MDCIIIFIILVRHQKFITMTDQNKRPTFLTVLCILTFIGSGFGVLGGLIGLVATGAATALAKIPMLGPALTAAASFGIVYTLINLILAAASLYGAIMMWKLKKTGFWIYVAAQVLMLIVPVFFVGIAGLLGSAIGLIFTAAFIIMYALNLKAMK